MERWKIGTISLAAAVAILLIVPYTVDTPLYTHPPKNPCSDSSSAMAERATIYDTLAPDERFDAADLVVIGRVIDSTAKCEGHNVMTYIQIEVEESLKNPQNLATLTAKMYGGTIGDYTVQNANFSLFEEGDRVFLYLYRDDDEAYRIDYYSGLLARDGSPDYSVSGKEILETFRLEFDTGEHDSIDVRPGSSNQVTLNLKSYFGYDSPTSLKVSSFAQLTDSGAFNSANLPV